MDHSNVASPVLKEGKFKDYVINYRKLRKILQQGFICVGAYAFLGVTSPIKPKKRRFLDYLEMSGFTPLSRELIKRSDGTYSQKGLDIFMRNYIRCGEMVKFRNSNKKLLGIALLSVCLLVLVSNGFYVDAIWDKIKRKRKRYDP